MIIWCDLETTGLDPHKDKVLEIALVATDDDLNIIDTHESLYFPEVLTFNTIAPEVRQMHVDSGLFNDVITKGVKWFSATYFLSQVYEVDWPHEIPKDTLAPLAGNSVHFDRSFLEHHIPDVLKFVSHRNIDVSSFKEVNKRWHPHFESFQKQEVHRAMPDILESIEELRFYRRIWNL